MQERTPPLRRSITPLSGPPTANILRGFEMSISRLFDVWEATSWEARGVINAGYIT
jgi:hypothetical protein